MSIDSIIDNNAAAKIKDEEDLLRLLCSPLFYDEETKQVNVDAFDLRMIKTKDGELFPESYVSLGRVVKMLKKKDFLKFLKRGYKIWDDKPNGTEHYSAYGFFKHQRALQISKSIEVYPLKDGPSYHIGMFYSKSENDYYEGPLPKDKEGVLDMLMGLASLLEERVSPAPVR